MAVPGAVETARLQAMSQPAARQQLAGLLPQRSLPLELPSLRPQSATTLAAASTVTQLTSALPIRSAQAPQAMSAQAVVAQVAAAQAAQAARVARPHSPIGGMPSLLPNLSGNALGGNAVLGLSQGMAPLQAAMGATTSVSASPLLAATAQALAIAGHIQKGGLTRHTALPGAAVTPVAGGTGPTPSLPGVTALTATVAGSLQPGSRSATLPWGSGSGSCPSLPKATPEQETGTQDPETAVLEEPRSVGVTASSPAAVTVCHLHKKPQTSCKFCQRYLSAKQQVEECNARRQAESRETSKKQIFNCSPMLKEQVLKSSYYKSLINITNLEDLAQEIQQYAADTMDVYRNPMEPSCFMCCVYRLFTLVHTEEELRRTIMDNPGSTLVRCVGFLFIRYVVPPEQLWEKLEEFVLDDAQLVIKTEGGREAMTTIGEYIESLLLKEKYYNTPLPRVPAAVRRKLEERLAPLPQYRKRTRANRRVFGGGLRGELDVSVEVCIGGIWRQGRALEVVDSVPSRLKVRVRMDDGKETLAQIGQVVLRGTLSTAPERRSRSSSRSRSRSRQARSHSPDWSRWKGKSDAMMVEELRERAREDAVCANRKDYARRPPRFDAGLAIKREHGSAEARLIEEETYIAPERRRRPTPEEEEERERVKRRRTDEEDERQRKLKDIYEKYGQQRRCESAASAGAGSSRYNELEGPDTMRLG